MRLIDADALVWKIMTLCRSYQKTHLVHAEMLETFTNSVLAYIDHAEEHKTEVKVIQYDSNLPTEPSKSTEQNVADVPSGYMCFSCKYGNRVGMPCKECKHDYEDKYTPINKYGTIPRFDMDLISRKSAICAIENTDCELTNGDWDELTDAINELPSADVVSREEYNKLLNDSIWESEHIGKMFEYQAEPSGDLISREEVHKVLSLLATEGGKDAKVLIMDAHEFIDALPSADRPSADVVHKPDYSYEADMVKRLKEATSADRHEYNLESIADIVKQLGHLDGCIADMCGRPQVNSNSAEEQIAETCDRPKGEWIDVENEPYCECSVCGAYIENLDDDFAFCPRCGADMRPEK